MALMHWLLFLAPCLLQGAAAAAASRSSQWDTARELGTADHFNDHLDWVKNIHRESLTKRDGVDGDDGDDPGGVAHEYHGHEFGFQGYSGFFKRSVLKQIEEDEHVAFIEADKIHAVECDKWEAAGKVKSSANVQNLNGNPATGLLTPGQGYNSFLQRGLVVDAVIWPDNNDNDHDDDTYYNNFNKRESRDASSAPEARIAVQTFNFTSPRAGPWNFRNVNLTEWLEMPDMSEIEASADAYERELLEKWEKDRQTNERNNSTTATSKLHSRHAVEECTSTMDIDTHFAKDHHSYFKALDISLGLTLSGWGQSAALSGNYLDQTTFSKKSLTYVVSFVLGRQVQTPGRFKLNMARYKPGNFTRDFGDSWIHGK
ncbi:subtilisin-like protease [Metarhizium album ARSEF 1941]|uniref:Subtilisin-like protease n=1 Tax=Metarhizium album (strain ARSEF 1941) TaxID=1081103 RepID=A0A0B2WP14_METAS|nr:subtilisin-like protease [Metarhizium album ARSEF 1941]KHN95227.1 subtilisin-like protease [Metarhizium album ARSEF 1941]